MMFKFLSIQGGCISTGDGSEIISIISNNATICVDREKYFELYPDASLPEFYSFNSENEIIYWKNKIGALHRADGPAVEHPNGRKSWYLNDKRHREDGPAIEGSDGSKIYYLNGQAHSYEEFKRLTDPKEKKMTSKSFGIVGGEIIIEITQGFHASVRSKILVKLTKNLSDPATEITREEYFKLYPEGYLPETSDLPHVYWYNSARKLHNPNGAAVEYANGDKHWFLNGERYRKDGPDTELANGNKEWGLYGKRYYKEGFYLADKKKIVASIAVPGAEVVLRKEEEGYTQTIYQKRGSSFVVLTDTEYFNLYPEGSLPTTNHFGTIFWKNKEGKYHRLDGPAIDRSKNNSLNNEWWINGIEYTQENFLKKIAEDKLMKIAVEYSIPGGKVALDNSTGKKVITLINEEQSELNKIVTQEEYFELYPEGSLPHRSMTSRKYTFWQNPKTGCYHRLDGPAVEYDCGDKHWYKNGQLHREDGPAIETIYGKEWWIEGERHRKDGPARESSKGNKTYWVNHKQYSEKEFLEKEFEKGKEFVIQGGRIVLNLVGKTYNLYLDLDLDHDPEKEVTREKYFELYPDASLPVKYSYGIVWENKDGLYHRLDGPAVEDNNGSKAWYKNHGIHREDGPAVEHSDGQKQWWYGNVLCAERSAWLHAKMLDKKLEWFPIPGGIVYFEDDKRIIDLGEDNIVTQEKYFELYPDGVLPSKIKENKGSLNRSGISWTNKEGKYHRLDGPAVKYEHGTAYWYKEGKIHREDGPAVERADGSKEYWLNSQFYPRHLNFTKAKLLEQKTEYFYIPGGIIYFSNNLPVIELEDDKNVTRAEYLELYPDATLPAMDGSGNIFWHREGKLTFHRADGPAVIYKGGARQWYYEGKLHRADGPAIEYPNGKKLWYLQGTNYSKEEFEVLSSDKSAPIASWTIYGGRVSLSGNSGRLRNIQLDNGKQVSPKEYFELYPDGFLPEKLDENIHWRDKDDNHHRIGGPAVMYKSGAESWYKHGKLHRSDGPAIRRRNGDEKWFLEGKEYSLGDYTNKTIKIDPPVEFRTQYKIAGGFAHIATDKTPEITLTTTGKRVTKEEYFEIYPDGSLPTINKNNDLYWHNKNGQLHNLDRSAVKNANGSERWYLNGKLHRDDGPAMTSSNGDKKWYKNGYLHRKDGPAVESSNGYKEWWHEGRATIKQGTNPHHDLLRHVEMKLDDEFSAVFTRVSETLDYSRIVYQKQPDLLLLEISADKYFEKHPDGALPNIGSNGTIIWKNKENKAHRENGPAFEHHNGQQKQWFINGVRHRLDGPAVDLGAVNLQQWYIDGKFYATEKEFEKAKMEVITVIIPQGSVEFIRPKQTDGYGIGEFSRIIHSNNSGHQEISKEEFFKLYPAASLPEMSNDTIVWKNSKRYYHRLNGAAVIYKNGDTAWYKNGKLHREDGPAIEYKDTDISDKQDGWFIEGKHYTEKQFNEWKKTTIEKSIMDCISKQVQLDVSKQSMSPENSPKLKYEYKTETPLSKLNPTAIDTLKQDVEQATYRVAGRQITKATKHYLIKLLREQGVEKKQLQALSVLLEDEVGEIFLSYLLGAGLTYLPSLQDNVRAQKLAKEFRVASMAGAGNLAFGGILKQFVSGLPAPRVRVGNLNSNAEELEEELMDNQILGEMKNV